MPPRHPPGRRRSPRRFVAVGGVLLAAVVGVVVWPTSHPVRFADVTAAAGVRFTHTNGAAGRKLLPETMGAGVVVLDFDADGRPDLYFVNSCPWPGGGPATSGALYRNNGDGTFADVTAASGLNAELFGLGGAAADFDNDGFPDLLVTAIGGLRLFRNDGGRRFVDVTESAGLPPSAWPARGEAFYAWKQDISFPASATWLDYDGDARPDLFVCEYVGWSPAADLDVAAVLADGRRAYVPPTQFPGTHCRLYRNVDGTRFEDVSGPAGVRVSGSAGEPVGKALGVVVDDFDRDGWPDVAVANDTVRNFFFHNRPGPAGGRVFVEKGLPTGLAYSDGRPRGGMGIDATELRPGRPGVVVANFSNEPNSLFALADPAKLLFADRAAADGLAGPSRPPMKFAAVFVDYDLDGRPDLFTANGHLEPDIGPAGQGYAQPPQLFRLTDRGFAEASAGDVGPDLFRPRVGRGAAYLDLDGDGDMDLVTTANGGPAKLFENRTRTGHHWLRLHLHGDGVRSNRDALGAEVVVDAGGVSRRFYVTAGRGYLSQSELAVTVGLGAEASVERITVRWPGAAAGTQTWEGVAADRAYHVRQGAGELEAVGRP